MHIDPSGLHPTRMNSDVGANVSSRRTQATPSDAGPDTVTVSSRARLLAMARQALDETALVRRAVVDDARARVAGGAGWDGREVATAMIGAVTEGRV